MKQVQRLMPLTDSTRKPSVTFCGGAHIEREWPKNPKGEDLQLIITLDSDACNQSFAKPLLPSGKYISVFSTFNPQRYFLDDLVFTGDERDYQYIHTRFTKVVVSNTASKQIHTNCLPEIKMQLVPYQIEDDAFPAYSFLSSSIPNGLKGYYGLLDEYDFVAQFYGANLSEQQTGLLGLSDANGYLFLKKHITDDMDAGFFFVQA